MKVMRILLLLSAVCAQAHGFAATTDQSAVNLRFEEGERRKLQVEGKTYSMLVNCSDAMIEKFTAGDQELIGDHPLCPIMDGGRVNGPTVVEIRQNGPVFAEIHLKGIWWTDLHADIEMVLYCFAKRVYAEIITVELGPPRKFALGWYGAAHYGWGLSAYDDQTEKALGFDGKNPRLLLTVPSAHLQIGAPAAEQTSEKTRTPSAARYNRITGRVSFSIGYAPEQPGPRRAWIVLLAEENHDALLDAFRAEYARAAVQATPRSNFLPELGATELLLDKTANRVTASVIPPGANSKPGVQLPAERLQWATPQQFVFSTVADAPISAVAGPTGDALGVPLQTVKEADGRYRSYFSTDSLSGTLFDGALATAPLAVSMVSDGPGYTTLHAGKPAFSYRFQDRLSLFSNGALVSGASGSFQAGLFRVREGGRWIRNVLSRTETYLTGPLLANLGATYQSPDHKMNTRVEIFEPSQSDAQRSYIKLAVDVQDTVIVDELRMFELVPAIGGGELAYTNADGATVREAVADATTDQQPVPLCVDAPFFAVLGAELPSVGCMISRVDGVAAEQPLRQLAVKYVREQGAQHAYLTLPGITQLAKGDRIEVHAFIVHLAPKAGSEFMETQRALYGRGLAKLTPQRGTAAPGYPRRVRLDAAGIAEFNFAGGSEDTPVILEGIAPGAVPLLWEKTGDQWMVSTRSWDTFQRYNLPDGGTAAVFLVDAHTDGTRHFAATLASGVEGIARAADLTVFSGKSLDITAPFALPGVTASPVDGGPFVRGRVAGELRVH